MELYCLLQIANTKNIRSMNISISGMKDSKRKLCEWVENGMCIQGIGREIGRNTLKDLSVVET